MTSGRLPRFAERIALAHGLHISPFCIGAVGDRKVIPAAFDAGINFFFISADLHWPLYEEARRGLADLLRRGGGVRDRIVIAGVSYVAPPFGLGAFSDLLDGLPALERIDMLVAGGLHQADFEERLECLHVLAGAPESGLGASSVAASFHDRGAARAAIDAGSVDIAYIRYNPMRPGARRDLLPHVRPERTTRIFNFKSMADPMLTAERLARLGISDDYWHPEPTDYYRFALTVPAMDGILFSPSEPSQIDALSSALEKGPLEPDEEDHLIAIHNLEMSHANVETNGLQ